MSIIEKICEVGVNSGSPPFSEVRHPTKKDPLFALREDKGEVFLHKLVNPDVVYHVGNTPSQRTGNILPYFLGDTCAYVLGHVMVKDPRFSGDPEKILLKAQSFIALMEEYAQKDSTITPLLEALKAGNFELPDDIDFKKGDTKVVLQWGAYSDPYVQNPRAQDFWKAHHATGRVVEGTYECSVCGNLRSVKEKFQNRDLVSNNNQCQSKFGQKDSNKAVNIPMCVECEDSFTLGITDLLAKSYGNIKHKLAFIGSDMSETLFQSLFEEEDITAQDLVSGLKYGALPKSSPESLQGIFMSLGRITDKEPFAIEDMQIAYLESIVSNIAQWNSTLSSVSSRNRPSFHQLKKGMIPSNTGQVFKGSESKFYKDLSNMALFGAPVPMEWMQILHSGALKGHKYFSQPYFAELFRRRNMKNQTLESFYYLGRAAAHLNAVQKKVSGNVGKNVLERSLQLLKKDPLLLIEFLHPDTSKNRWYFKRITTDKGDYGYKSKMHVELANVHQTFNDDLEKLVTRKDKIFSVNEFLRGVDDVYKETRKRIQDSKKEGGDNE